MNNSNTFSIRHEIGFALMLIGVQTGTAIRNVVGIEMVNIIMAVSVLCVMNFKNLFSLKFPCWNKYFLLLWIFQIIELAYSTYCTEDISKYIPMHLYLMSITLALSTQDTGKEFRYADVFFMYLSLFITLVVAYQATHGFAGVYTSNEFYREDLGHSQMEQGGDKITMGRALLFSIICAIVYRQKYKWELLIKALAVGCAFVGLMMFNTRASMAVALICLVVYIIKKSQISSGASLFSGQSIRFVLKYLILASVLLSVLYFQIGYVKEMVDNLFFNLTRGILTLFGDNSLGIDESTIYRNTVMRNIFQEDSSFLELLFGHGYYTMYIDIPMFQAFYDFGIFGILYFILLGYNPARYIIKNNTAKAPVMMVLLFSIQYLLDQVYCGLPYFFFQFMPIILLVFFYYNNITNYGSLSISCASRQ